MNYVNACINKTICPLVDALGYGDQDHP